MRRAFGPIGLVLALTAALVSPADAATQVSCGNEDVMGTRQAFVKDGPHQGAATGVMGNMYAYDRDMWCGWFDDGDDDDEDATCNFAVSAVQLDLGYWPDATGGLGLFQVEGGYYYDGCVNDPRPKAFMHAQLGSQGTMTFGNFLAPLDAWMGFNVSPHTYSGVNNAVYKVQYTFGESQTGWMTLGTSPVMPDRTGTPAAEMERIERSDGADTSSGETFIRALKYRPTSGWFNWSHMVCDTAYNNETEWDVTKFTEQAYYMVRRAPEAGGC